jgi:CHAT domain-containing protein
MFERFTEKAIKVIMLAQEEARRLGHNFVGAEFIFLGLIGEATGVAAKVLRQQGITLKNARIEVEKILGRGSGTITVELPFTESAKLVFNGAWSISEQLGSEFIDTEHLLIGIFQEGESIGKVLQNLRVNPQNLALSLSQYFQHQPSNQLPQNVDVQEYKGFLSEVLQAVYESPRDSTVVYPILQRRQHLLDDTFAQLLQQWARNVFSQENAEDVATIALVIQLLCIEIAQFPLGSRANNLEIAITGYQTLLEVYTRDAFPNEWATSQNNLGAAYRDRIRGEKADNLELAITALNQSLEVTTREAFPYEWAGTQNNLGAAYGDRIRGEKADNLELAIAAFNLSLEVTTREAFPYEWAGTQNNLGDAYLYRIRGEKADNLELAITALNQSLEVYTREALPYEWARSQHNLGAAYLTRIRGERADNLELAITALNQSLEARTREAFPYEWAMTQNNLGAAYSDRIRGEKADNLELAITALNLSLEVYTREALPYEWARSQNLLANAYGQRIRGEKADNLELAIVAYNLSLEVYTPTAFPIECLITGRNLGITANLIEDWETAIKGYNLAIEAVENTRLEALNPQRQQEILSDAMDVYHGIVQSYLNLNQPDRALEYVERSKTRYLVQLLTDRDIYPKGNIPQTIITELDRLRRAIIGEEQQLAIQEQTRNRGVNLTLDEQKQPILNDYTHLNHLKQELNQFIDREITDIDPTFSLTQKVQTIPLSEIQALIDQQTAILEWYIAGDRIMAFIVTAEGLIPPNPPSKGGDFDSEVKGVKVWQSSESDLQIFIETIDNYLQLYYSENSKQEWIKKLPNFLQSFSEILHLTEIINLIPSTCQRLIIIPHRFLHILPIHAFPIGEDKVLQNKYTVQYAPSCQLLQRIQQLQQNQLTPLLAIQNPTKDLIFTDLEVNIIATLFQPNQIIAKDNATQNTVTTQLKNSNHHCHHFSCHGSFNPNKPLGSALILAEQEPLTLGKIFELNLKKSRLVVLSACETGMIDIQSISDEYIGLPSGFLFAGSQNVVSSLWTVNDLSTAFLMIKFYQILLDSNQQVSMAIALKTAQNWLRTLNREKFTSESNKIISKLDNKKPRMAESYKKIAGQLLLQNTEEYPFQNPYYWAAFIASGH